MWKRKLFSACMSAVGSQHPVLRLQVGCAAEAVVGGAASRQSFYSMDVQQVPQGMGSGFIWDDKVHTRAACVQLAESVEASCS